MSEHASLIPRYKHLRKVGLELNNRLVETLAREDIGEGARALGLLHKGQIVLDTEDEICLLMDYCLHDLRRNGTNAIERFLANTPPGAGSDELIILQARCQARFCLFVVESIEPGVGVQGRDLLRDETFFLTDIGFS